jgi:hypothetical protein
MDWEKWTPGGALPDAREGEPQPPLAGWSPAYWCCLPGHASGIVEDKLFVFGGFQGGDRVNTTFSLDLGALSLQ